MVQKKKKARGKRATNPWIDHVKAYSQEHPDKRWSKCLKEARGTYAYLSNHEREPPPYRSSLDPSLLTPPDLPKLRSLIEKIQIPKPDKAWMDRHAKVKAELKPEAVPMTLLRNLKGMFPPWEQTHPHSNMLYISRRYHHFPRLDKRFGKEYDDYALFLDKNSRTYTVFKDGVSYPVEKEDLLMSYRGGGIDAMRLLSMTLEPDYNRGGIMLTLNDYRLERDSRCVKIDDASTVGDYDKGSYQTCLYQFKTRLAAENAVRDFINSFDKDAVVVSFKEQDVPAGRLTSHILTIFVHLLPSRGDVRHYVDERHYDVVAQAMSNASFKDIGLQD